MTAICSGLRANELRSLRYRHLDPVRGGLCLEASWTKNRKPRFQPLRSGLLKRLIEAGAGRQPEDELFFVPTQPAREFYRDLDRAGIARNVPGLGKVDFHALRTAYTTLLVESEATLKEAQSLARHSDPRLTMNVYAKARTDRLQEVAQTVGDALNLEAESQNVDKQNDARSEVASAQSA